MEQSFYDGNESQATMLQCRWELGHSCNNYTAGVHLLTPSISLTHQCRCIRI